MNHRCKVLSFPNQIRAIEIARNFEQLTGFPGIIGAIDGCHIRILKPMEYPNSYINRKGYPSILLQGICDNKKLFLDVYAGEPGSLHDARLFTKSDIF
ncbi:unnamed protein product [Callosobruchus maculatus]|uniref:DDE Tnp4 domain-containing protein n=1 Tax=Callosobruchus maculatus TaxID=64391 RepID=A0A653CRR8_CALMS|nr:unnamed protein product [Callosobruchus maculatus]